MLETEQGI